MFKKIISSLQGKDLFVLVKAEAFCFTKFTRLLLLTGCLWELQGNCFIDGSFKDIFSRIWQMVDPLCCCSAECFSSKLLEFIRITRRNFCQTIDNVLTDCPTSNLDDQSKLKDCQFREAPLSILCMTGNNCNPGAPLTPRSEADSANTGESRRGRRTSSTCQGKQHYFLKLSVSKNETRG